MTKPRGFSTGFSAGFGVGRYRYALIPWTWGDIGGENGWTLPKSVVGSVDLRNLSQQATAGGTPQGVAFVASMQPVTGTDIITALYTDEPATTAMLDAWQAGMGYRPSGPDLSGLLWDQLTTGADPSGQSGPKPLMPGANGLLELHLGGHSLIRSEKFLWGKHPHTNQVQAVLHRDFEEMWERTNGHDHCCRVLDATCDKYGVDDWKELVPRRLHQHVPGRLPHATSFTESFNKADSTTLGPDLTWTETLNDLEVSGNTCRAVASDGTFSDARAEHDVSSTDHYAQITLVTALPTVTNNTDVRALARFDSSARTHYGFTLGTSGGNLIRQVFKRVTGTFTSLSGPTNTSYSVNDTAKIQCSGSSITGYWNSTAEGPVTDTSITTGTRGGIGTRRQGDTTALDSFVVSDLAAAAFQAVAGPRFSLAAARGLAG